MNLALVTLGYLVMFPFLGLKDNILVKTLQILQQIVLNGMD